MNSYYSKMGKKTETGRSAGFSVHQRASVPMLSNVKLSFQISIYYTREINKHSLPQICLGENINLPQVSLFTFCVFVHVHNIKNETHFHNSIKRTAALTKASVQNEDCSRSCRCYLLAAGPKQETNQNQKAI